MKALNYAIAALLILGLITYQLAFAQGAGGAATDGATSGTFQGSQGLNQSQNAFGQRFDQFGNPLDQFGNRINTDQSAASPNTFGQSQNQFRTDRFGNTVDQFGQQRLDISGNPINSGNSPTDQFGNPIQRSGQTDQFGDPIFFDRFGNRIDVFGNRIFPPSTPTPSTTPAPGTGSNTGSSTGSSTGSMGGIRGSIDLDLLLADSPLSTSQAQPRTYERSNQWQPKYRNTPSQQYGSSQNDWRQRNKEILARRTAQWQGTNYQRNLNPADYDHDFDRAYHEPGQSGYEYGTYNSR